MGHEFAPARSSSFPELLVDKRQRICIPDAANQYECSRSGMDVCLKSWVRGLVWEQPFSKLPPLVRQKVRMWGLLWTIALARNCGNYGVYASPTSIPDSQLRVKLPPKPRSISKHQVPFSTRTQPKMHAATDNQHKHG